jgi:hypothetical protein
MPKVKKAEETVSMESSTTTLFNYLTYFPFLVILLMNMVLCSVKYRTTRRHVFAVIWVVCFFQAVQGVTEFIDEEDMENFLVPNLVVAGISERISTIIYCALIVWRLYSIRFQLSFQHRAWFIALYLLVILSLLPSMVIGVLGCVMEVNDTPEWLEELTSIQEVLDLFGSSVVVLLVLVVDSTLVYTIALGTSLQGGSFSKEKMTSLLGRVEVLIRQPQAFRITLYLVLMALISFVSLVCWGLGFYAPDKLGRAIAWVINYVAWALHYTFEIYFQELVSNYLGSLMLLRNAAIQTNKIKDTRTMGIRRGFEDSSVNRDSLEQ